MKKINLAITGCLGRMGQQLIKSSKKNKNFNLVSLTENKTLADLNSEYFTPIGRTIPENHIFKLEHFVVAKSKSL